MTRRPQMAPPPNLDLAERRASRLAERQAARTQDAALDLPVLEDLAGVLAQMGELAQRAVVLRGQLLDRVTDRGHGLDRPIAALPTAVRMSAEIVAVLTQEAQSRAGG